MSIRIALLIILFNMMSFRGSKVLVSLYAIELGASQLAIGALIAVYALIPALLAVHAGRLSDRLGVRLPMLAGSLGLTGGLLLPYLHPSLTALYVSAALIGGSHMLYNVSMQNLIGSLGGEENSARNFSNYALAMAFGSFLGPLAAGLSIDHAGYATTYLYLALIPVVPCLILAGAGRMGGGHAARSKEGRAADMKGLLSNPALRRTLIAGAIATTGHDLFHFYLPIYGNSVGLSASAIGVVLGLFGIAAFVVRMALPALVKRWNTDAVFNGSLYLSAAAFLVFPLLASPLALAAVSIVLGLGMGCAQPVTLMLIYSRAPQGRSGEALGTRVTINQFMHITVPLIYGSLGTVLGVAPVFVVNSLIMAGGGLLNRPPRKRSG